MTDQHFCLEIKMRLMYWTCLWSQRYQTPPNQDSLPNNNYIRTDPIAVIMFPGHSTPVLFLDGTKASDEKWGRENLIIQLFQQSQFFSNRQKRASLVTGQSRPTMQVAVGALQMCTAMTWFMKQQDVFLSHTQIAPAKRCVDRERQCPSSCRLGWKYWCVTRGRVLGRWGSQAFSLSASSTLKYV